MTDDIFRMRYAAVDQVMQTFDFYKVAIAMQAVDWGWLDGGVPTVAQLKETARRLLVHTANDNQAASSSLATGGFTAHRDGERFTLEFTLEDAHYPEE